MRIHERTHSIVNQDAAKTSTPAMHAASVRSVPNPTRDVVYRMPINVSDQFERPYMIPYTCPGRGELYADALRALEGQQVALKVYSRGIDTHVLVERLETVAPSEPHVGSTATVMFLTVRGQRTDAGAAGGGAATEGYALGLNDLGTADLGVGEGWT